MQFSDGTQTDMANIQCQWNQEYTSTFPDISTAQCVWTHCSNPPLPPDEKNLKSVDWDGNPILIGESITFNCVDNMKTEDAFIDASVTITCGADNTFSPSDPDWPQCVPSKSHCLSRYLFRWQKKLTASNLPFQVFEGIIRP